MIAPDPLILLFLGGWIVFLVIVAPTAGRSDAIDAMIDRIKADTERRRAKTADVRAEVERLKELSASLKAENAKRRAQNADLQDAVLGLEALVDHLRSGEPTRSLEEVMAELPPVTPGEILQEDFLKPMGLTVAQLAEGTGIPQGLLREILGGIQPINPDIDQRLCRYFKLSEGYWLRAQAAHDGPS